MALTYRLEDLDGMTPSRSHPDGKDLAKDLVGSLNGPAGLATLLAGNSTVDVQLDAALDGKPAFAMMNGIDATATQALSATWDGSGKLTLTANANATADVTMAYFVDGR